MRISNHPPVEFRDVGYRKRLGRIRNLFINVAPYHGSPRPDRIVHAQIRWSFRLIATTVQIDYRLVTGDEFHLGIIANQDKLF